MALNLLELVMEVFLERGGRVCVAVQYRGAGCLYQLLLQLCGRAA